MLAYLFLGWFYSDADTYMDMVSLISVILLSAADFWYVPFNLPGSKLPLPMCFCRVTKNVSGRLLAGLRWWHEVKEDGTESWVFESLEVDLFSRLFSTSTCTFITHMHLVADHRKA
jgi:hypothetical protein